jgi:hypothetical protein
MAIISGPSGPIQVRIRKAPFDAAKPMFFDEYAQLGVRDDKMKCSRCLIPEDMTYSIHVVVKSSFKFEKWLGIRIKIIDEARNCEILNEKYEKDSKGTTDQIIEIEKVGQGNNAVNFSMNTLPSGNIVP